MALELRCEGRGASQGESSRKRLGGGDKTHQQERPGARAWGEGRWRVGEAQVTRGLGARTVRVSLEV